MTRKDHRRDALHGPWPTTAEALGARYSDQWDIWRELRPDGSHGDWIAKRISAAPESDNGHAQIRSATIQGLAELLEWTGQDTSTGPPGRSATRAALFWSDPGDPDRERAELTLPARRHAPGDARRFVAAQLRKWDLDRLVDACQLVASELTTNAVRFAGDDHTIVVGLRLTGRRLVCEVWDPSPEPPVPVDAGALDEDGRGLLLVASAADGWTYHPSPAGDGKVVLAWWARP